MLNELNIQMEKIVQELYYAIDLATPLDHKDELKFDIDDLQDVLDKMETICNKSEGIEDEDDE